MTSHPIGQYAKLEEAARYFVHEAFRHAHAAAEYEVAGLLYGGFIESVTPPADWKVPPISGELPDFLNKDVKVLPNHTIKELSAAWHEAQVAARSAPRRLAPSHKMSSIDLAGHGILLAAAVEVMTNRELLLRKEGGQIRPDHFKHLDRASVMAKLLFLFKDEATNDTLDINHIAALFRLRNNAVHLGALKTSSLSKTPQELRQMWRATAQLAGLATGTPTQAEIDAYADGVCERWFE